MFLRNLAALLIPVLLMFMVAISIFVPRYYLKPAQNFIFSLQYFSAQTLTTEYYLYDVKHQQANLLTSEKMAKLPRAGGIYSRQGLYVEAAGNQGLFIFSPANTYYLVGRGYSEVIHLPAKPEKQYWQFRFISWVA